MDGTIIRIETVDDISEIRALVEAAFPTPAEARLVDQLRNDGDAVVSMVATVAGSLVGHVMLSEMNAPFRALGLAPVAVAPEHQGKGIGTLLVRAALDRAASGEWDAIFVLGSPRFYQKFGFDPHLASGFISPYAGPHLMALAIKRPLPAKTGKVEYASAFASLG